MNLDIVPTKFAKIACLLLWLAVIALPLTVLAVEAVSSPAQPEMVQPVLASLLRTCVLAAIIGTVAVVLGWLPGRLLGTLGKGQALLLLLLLMPLVLPQYVLYYAWTLLLSPTTYLGRALASRPELAQLVGLTTSTGVLIGWCWPLAALVLAQGWRSIDGRVWEGASLEARPSQVLRHVTFPLLSRTILLAFGVCFVLSLSEFATFNLAGVRTIGTELSVLYELTGASAPVARAAWPVTLIALPVAVALTLSSNRWTPTTVTVKTTTVGSPRRAWAVTILLLSVSWLAPVVLLVASVTTWEPFRQFLTLHLDDLAWSLLTAGVAASLACLLALGGLFSGPGPLRRVLSLIVGGTIFLAMFLPASLPAVSLLKLSTAPGIRQSWLLVSAGQASRFAGLALVMLLLTRYPDRRQLAEMAALDGASPLQAWRHVHLPRVWPVLGGTFLLVTMLGLTELPATMVLLPAGLPNFAQRLLNQMHYARDQQVIASCLILILLFFLLAGVVVALLRMAGGRHIGRVRITHHLVPAVKWCVVRTLPVLVVLVAGCGHKTQAGEPKVIETFGGTGAGPGEFLYPRGIDLDRDGSVLVVDKTGRIQRFTEDGRYLSTIRMPQIEAGKPTGMSVHPDGRLFVADTHYHRVVIFSQEGKQIGEFGKYGEEDGCFIYPTDVAFAPDGRIFVSEYGGNDRISVFTSEGGFLFSFGSLGKGEGQFSRPQSLCVDELRGRLYVADACNHRIGVYDLDGHLVSYIGSLGTGPGQLRYPYGLSLLGDGTLAVCEYGNNRIQLFSPEGQSLAIYGQAGRQLGELAYPWAVAVDSHRRAFVVDAGNNRIQVWQL